MSRVGLKSKKGGHKVLKGGQAKGADKFPKNTLKCLENDCMQWCYAVSYFSEAAPLLLSTYSWITITIHFPWSRLYFVRRITVTESTGSVSFSCTVVHSALIREKLFIQHLHCGRDRRKISRMMKAKSLTLLHFGVRPMPAEVKKEDMFSSCPTSGNNKLA